MHNLFRPAIKQIQQEDPVRSSLCVAEGLPVLQNAEELSHKLFMSNEDDFAEAQE